MIRLPGMGCGCGRGVEERCPEHGDHEKNCEQRFTSAKHWIVIGVSHVVIGAKGSRSHPHSTLASLAGLLLRCGSPLALEQWHLMTSHHLRSRRNLKPRLDVEDRAAVSAAWAAACRRGFLSFPRS
mmetsp:Transcript_107246/g.148317  ORF Transcript_107246/g.148317 Transcript_107246/m.148317 type:complete len:126 (-) Transcript_107246:154-531(-)